MIHAEIPLPVLAASADALARLEAVNRKDAAAIRAHLHKQVLALELAYNQGGLDAVAEVRRVLRGGSV
ncbi:hypothetical protein HDC94_001964 [Leifsonia sp. AK011]|uniref:hypothetical protein n=1 Tax=Leifsonia sp. AK011 TaxID=2723075 RepID=UPI0015CAFC3F|nr:hypothetical protein [Leifsonia sp. AK011]NYF10808.1 hypothetical protein [Leifsonia sp. AK011]